MKFLDLANGIKLFFELIRIRNCLMGFFGVFVVVILLNFESILEVTILFAGISVFFIMAAGNMINDYFDFEIDKIDKKTKPLPSGRIKRCDVLMLSVVFFLLGIGISKLINIYCFGISILNSAFLILYAKYSKRTLLVSNLGVSYLIASIFIFGALATGIETMTQNQMKILTILTACAFLMTLSREIVKDIEDIEGDRKNYSITLPIKFGVKRAKKLAMFFALTAIIISLFPFFIHLELFELQVYGVFIGIANIIFLVSFTMHPSITQRLMVLGMSLALGGFFLGKFIPIYFASM